MWRAVSDELPRIDHRVLMLNLHWLLSGVPAAGTALMIRDPLRLRAQSRCSAKVWG